MTEVTLEQELIEFCKVKPKATWGRQKLLEEVAKALDKMTENDFGKITDRGLQWFERAAKANKANLELPDFDALPEEETAPVKAKRTKPGRTTNDYKAVDGNTDKFGSMVGTKTHTVNNMLVAGATMKEIREATGANQYNHMKDLRERGHLIEKTEDGKFHLKHKDEA